MSMEHEVFFWVVWMFWRWVLQLKPKVLQEVEHGGSGAEQSDMGKARTHLMALRTVKTKREP